MESDNKEPEKSCGSTKVFKVDLHCHILPKRWPDLKEVSYNLCGYLLVVHDLGLLFSSVMGMEAGSS